MHTSNHQFRFCPTTQIVGVFGAPKGFYGLAWHPQGDRLAVVGEQGFSVVQIQTSNNTSTTN